MVHPADFNALCDLRRGEQHGTAAGSSHTSVRLASFRLERLGPRACVEVCTCNYTAVDVRLHPIGDGSRALLTACHTGGLAAIDQSSCLARVPLPNPGTASRATDPSPTRQSDASPGHLAREHFSSASKSSAPILRAVVPPPASQLELPSPASSLQLPALDAWLGWGQEEEEEQGTEEGDDERVQEPPGPGASGAAGVDEIEWLDTIHRVSGIFKWDGLATSPGDLRKSFRDVYAHFDDGSMAQGMEMLGMCPQESSLLGRLRGFTNRCLVCFTNFVYSYLEHHIVFVVDRYRRVPCLLALGWGGGSRISMRRRLVTLLVLLSPLTGQGSQDRVAVTHT